MGHWHTVIIKAAGVHTGRYFATEWSGTSPFQCCADTRSSFEGAFSVLPNAELLVRALSGYVALRTSAACPKHSVF